MGKYDPLMHRLAESGASEVPMTFGEIEAVIGAALPPVARKHRAWWSNNPSNSVITRAWLEAGYRTARVDMADERLVFQKVDAASPKAAEATVARKPGLLARVQARFAGTVKVGAGVDLTAPTGEEWDAER